MDIFDVVNSVLTSGAFSALCGAYIGHYLTNANRRANEKQTSQAVQALFLSCLYSYAGYLKSRSSLPWENYFWYKNQIEVAKYFPQQAHEFALLLEGLYSDNIEDKIERLHIIANGCKSNQKVRRW